LTLRPARVTENSKTNPNRFRKLRSTEPSLRPRKRVAPWVLF